jgi:hypothetical protein
MVLYPMPSCTRIKPRLAAEMKLFLEDFRYTPELKAAISGSSALSDFLLWTLVLGGIAASFTPNRQWFENRLRCMLRFGRRPSQGSDRKTWIEFKSRVSKFLWWDFVVDSPALDLWTEAMASTDNG